MQVVFKHLQITVLNLNTNFLSEEVYVYREHYWHRSAKADTADALCSYIQRELEFYFKCRIVKIIYYRLYMSEGVGRMGGMMLTGDTDSFELKLVPVSLVCLKSHIDWSGNESSSPL